MMSIKNHVLPKSTVSKTLRRMISDAIYSHFLYEGDALYSVRAEMWRVKDLIKIRNCKETYLKPYSMDHPVILVELEPDVFMVVDGRKRIWQARHKGKNKLQVNILTILPPRPLTKEERIITYAKDCRDLVAERR